MGFTHPRTLPVRLQVRFTAEELARFRKTAVGLGLPLRTTVRLLALRALADERDSRLDELEAVTVAALMAAEHSLRLLELVTPGAMARSKGLADDVRLSALERVAQVRRELGEAEP